MKNKTKTILYTATFAASLFLGLGQLNAQTDTIIAGPGGGGGTDQDCHDKFEIDGTDLIRFCGDCNQKRGKKAAHANKC